jgi:hypothetical protein
MSGTLDSPLGIIVRDSHRGIDRRAEFVFDAGEVESSEVLYRRPKSKVAMNAKRHR